MCAALSVCYLLQIWWREILRTEYEEASLEPTFMTIAAWVYHLIWAILPVCYTALFGLYVLYTPWSWNIIFRALQVTLCIYGCAHFIFMEPFVMTAGTHVGQVLPYWTCELHWMESNMFLLSQLLYFIHRATPWSIDLEAASVWRFQVCFDIALYIVAIFAFVVVGVETWYHFGLPSWGPWRMARRYYLPYGLMIVGTLQSLWIGGGLKLVLFEVEDGEEEEDEFASDTGSESDDEDVF